MAGYTYLQRSANPLRLIQSQVEPGSSEEHRTRSKDDELLRAPWCSADLATYSTARLAREAVAVYKTGGARARGRVGSVAANLKGKGNASGTRWTTQLARPSSKVNLARCRRGEVFLRGAALNHNNARLRTSRKEPRTSCPAIVATALAANHIRLWQWEAAMCSSAPEVQDQILD
ncbi:hypothetical protein HPB51_022194 [Rhipicephalus microplus]|uniref:Uncharacterized protein n=1 Tax=Rhipicephalus microplus TaxID=6941 RepID=A0A9J6F6C8_RHIMP|nr:hypothetical protein HPB51_022194 [Rhipicephalus microplus]